MAYFLKPLPKWLAEEVEEMETSSGNEVAEASVPEELPWPAVRQSRICDFILRCRKDKGIKIFQSKDICFWFVLVKTSSGAFIVFCLDCKEDKESLLWEIPFEVERGDESDLLKKLLEQDWFNIFIVSSQHDKGGKKDQRYIGFKKILFPVEVREELRKMINSVFEYNLTLAEPDFAEAWGVYLEEYSFDKGVREEFLKKKKQAFCLVIDD